MTEIMDGIIFITMYAIIGFLTIVAWAFMFLAAKAFYTDFIKGRF